MIEPCRLIEVRVPDKTVHRFWEQGRLDNLEEALSLPVNAYLLLAGASPKTKALCRHIGSGSLVKLFPDEALAFQGIKPRDSRQSAFMDSLVDPSVILSVGLGAAGTGKTTLAAAYALDMLMRQNKTIYLSKPVSLVANENENHDAFGPVPGDVAEKFQPHLASFEVVFSKIAGGKMKDYMAMMVKAGSIQTLPIEYTRGCTFENCTFILDEAQNTSWHQMKSFVSRMGEGAKCILLGDPSQRDIPGGVTASGLYKLISSRAFEESAVTSGIELRRQYRGPLPALMSDIDRETYEKLDSERSNLA